jgi:hypothetical protein
VEQAVEDVSACKRWCSKMKSMTQGVEQAPKVVEQVVRDGSGCKRWRRIQGGGAGYKG